MNEQIQPEFDIEKYVNSDLMRLNLLLCSLYLSGFEILKFTIVDSVAVYFVDFPPYSEEQKTPIREHLGDEAEEMIESRQSRYEAQVKEYETEVGNKYFERDRNHYIRSDEFLKSYQYLVRIGALEKSVLLDIERIRKHRNEIAHELPHFLTSKGFEVELDLFWKMRQILHTVTVFFARAYDDVPSDIPDEDIFTGPVNSLDMIWYAVRGYVDQLAETQEKRDSEDGSH